MKPQQYIPAIGIESGEDVPYMQDVPEGHIWEHGPTYVLITDYDELEKKYIVLKEYTDCWERLGKEVCEGMVGAKKPDPKSTYNKLQILLKGADDENKL